MRLAFVYAPVPELAAALPFYRDTLGLDEAWREGEDTVAYQLPDGPRIMVSVSTDPAGPMYLVDSVAAYLAERPELTVFLPPREIPDGVVAGFHDPAGNVMYVFDQVA
jgi:catechol 2,3-dioxygenase-like lactoylglutathione lyase family enzyme